MIEEKIDGTEDTGELYEHYKFVADPRQSPLRVDKFLQSRIENASRNKVQQAATAGNVLVNDKVVKSNYKVKPGDVVIVVMSTPPKVVDIFPQELELNIVFEDDDVIIIDKQAGLVVHPGFGNEDSTLLNGLMYYFEKTNQNIENGFGYLVHRIDKDTSGLLIIAKNEMAQTKLGKQFYDHSIERKYQALVWGDFEEEEGSIEGHIGRSLKDRRKMTVFPNGEYGKHAISHYKVLKRFGYVSLVECKLETGRTHQIRAHFSHIKHPLFNDEKYGGDQILKGTTFTKYKQFIQNCFKIIPRQSLHAYILGFVHPTSGKTLRFESELPEDMTLVLEKWENYAQHKDLFVD
ncbi:MAG: RNA pseudouridine synthase [Marinilabiliales bacterium]|nr:MAG: RNA pseudouridine synthase [Marinilabiliales bacterium]